MPKLLGLHSPQVQRGIDLYKAGHTLEESADLSVLNTITLSKYLKQAGVDTRTRRWSQAKIDECIRLYQNGLTLKQVAKIVGGKYQTVAIQLQKAGIPLRSKSELFSGERNPAWKNGRRTMKGYTYVYSPDYPHKTSHNHVAEHRLVMEQKLGRHLLPTEVVDHINGDKADNRPENLQVFASNGEHLKTTLKGRCPKWTEDGLRRLAEAQRTKRPRSRNSGQQTAGAGQ